MATLKDPQWKQEEIKIESEDTTTRIKPKTESGEHLARAANEFAATGTISNEELEKLGESFKKALDESYAGSSKSRRIQDNVYNVIDDLQTLMREKNYDERLQDAMKKMDVEATGLSKEEQRNLNAESRKALQIVRHMGPLVLRMSQQIYRDPEFRKILMDIVDIFGERAEETKRGAESGTSMKEAIKADISQPSGQSLTSQVIQQKAESAKENVSELSEGEKEELKLRTIKLIKHIRGHEDYPMFLNDMLNLYDEAIYMYSIVNQSDDARRTLKENESAISDVKVLAERFCNKSLDPWLEQLNKLQQAQNDPTYSEIRRGFEDLFFDPNEKYQSDDDIRFLLDIIRDNINQLNYKYEYVMDNFWNETRNVLDGFRNDTYLRRLADDWNGIVNEAFTDSSGNFNMSVAIDSIDKLQSSFFPVVKEQFSSGKLPAIEVESSSYIFSVDGLYADISSVLPDQFEIVANSKSKINTKENTKESDTHLQLKISNMDLKMERINFYYKSKTGFRYKDYGIIDVEIKDASLLINLQMYLDENEYLKIRMGDVNMSVNNLDITIHEAKHKLLDRIMSFVFKPAIKGRIDHLIESNIREAGINLCKTLNESIESNATRPNM